MADQKDKKTKKKESLDLVSEKAKPSRRQRQREEANASKKKTVDAQKREALDIFSDEGKKKAADAKKAKKKAAKKDVLPSISKIGEEKPDEFSAAKKASEENATDVADTPSVEVTSGDGDEKIILLKPPIIVSELAESMDLKPFQLMADLIKLEVFVAPTQAIEPDIAEKLCASHGFKCEREKREKGGGVHKVEEKFVEPEKEEEEPEDEMKLRAVIAADDGIMPQTKEAISHAQAAEKTIIVAINKCDKDGADPMKAMSQLMEHGLTPVDFGGDTECVQVSAITGQGMDDLLELMALQAEVLELKANPSANARAVVIEASIQAGKGPTASVIVQNGTLKVGQPFICGPFQGKIKSMLDDNGKRVKEAGPATPVEVIGFAELPNVGDEMVQMESERSAKKLSEERQTERRQKRLGGNKMSRMEDILAFAQEGGQKARLQLILKTDVQGSVGAIEGAIEEIESEKVEAKFLHAAAGAITETDVMLASSAGATILGFNTKVEGKAVTAAKREGVEIKLYSIVYELIDTVKKAAGCIIQDGKVDRKAHARVIRDGIPVFDGKMSTLRRFMDEVQEVKTGIECGIRLGSFDGYEEDDIIECYQLEKIDQTL